MSVLWTAEAARAATGGAITRSWQATGVAIDTRELQPGDLFVALADQRDGHDFLAQALEKGAAAALVNRIPPETSPDAPLLVVPDVLRGLEALGRAARARTKARVVGITGSVGKTSTKEMLRLLLSDHSRVHAAERSFNNHWGVPLTLARMPEAAEVALIEIGMNAPGEIAPLARMARLDVAVITTVAPAHLAAFDDLEAIAFEKAAIFEGLEPGGLGDLNADTEAFGLQRAALGTGRLATFGAAPLSDFRLLAAEPEVAGTSVHAIFAGAEQRFFLGGAGRHFALNALAALAVVAELGGDLAAAMAALRFWSPPDGRGRREPLLLDPAGRAVPFELIDDAFNANPASVAAALDVLAAAQPPAGGRRIAILGDMLELGPSEAALHRALAAHPGLGAIAQVHCVGPRMAALWEALPPRQRGLRAETVSALLPELSALIAPGDILLVKGSKSTKVSQLVDALRKQSEEPRPNPRGDL